jgi:hypothetical protein
VVRKRGGFFLPASMKAAFVPQQRRRKPTEWVYLFSVTTHMQMATGSVRFANGPGDAEEVSAFGSARPAGVTGMESINR